MRLDAHQAPDCNYSINLPNDYKGLLKPAPQGASGDMLPPALYSNFYFLFAFLDFVVRYRFCRDAVAFGDSRKQIEKMLVHRCRRNQIALGEVL